MDIQDRYDLIFMHGNQFPDCRARVDKHYIGYCSLQYCSSGEVELYCGEQRYEIGPGHFWACWPGPRVRFHSRHPRNGWEHHYIAFTGMLVRHWQDEGLIPKQPVLAVSAALPLEYWTKKIDAVITQGLSAGRFSRLRAINDLENLLYGLAEAETRQSPDQPWLKQVLSVLATAGNFPDYAAVARQLHISERTLRRRFQSLMGTSLHEHTIQNRLQTACQLLRMTDHSIAEVASQLGYKDIFFFSRQFSQRMNLTPTAFRESRQ